MIRSLLRWPGRKPRSPRRLRVLVDGVELATLQHPMADEMFWTSFEIVASTAPPDDRLADDQFWLDSRWKLVDADTGRPLPLAIASASGLKHACNRVLIRGLAAI